MMNDKTTRKLARLVPLIGRPVVVEWRDESDDWPTYRLLAVGVGATSGKPRVRIIGRDDDDGTKWVGDPFWTDLADIAAIEESTNA